MSLQEFIQASEKLEDLQVQSIYGKTSANCPLLNLANDHDFLIWENLLILICKQP